MHLAIITSSLLQREQEVMQVTSCNGQRLRRIFACSVDFQSCFVLKVHTHFQLVLIYTIRVFETFKSEAGPTISRRFPRFGSAF